MTAPNDQQADRHPASTTRATPSRTTTPAGAQAIARLHHSIARLHVIAIGFWLLAAAVTSVLTLAEVGLPTYVPVVSLIIAAIHGLFLALHRWLAHRAMSKAAAATQDESPPT